MIHNYLHNEKYIYKHINKGAISDSSDMAEIVAVDLSGNNRG